MKLIGYIQIKEYGVEWFYYDDCVSIISRRLDNGGKIYPDERFSNFCEAVTLTAGKFFELL